MSFDPIQFTELIERTLRALRVHSPAAVKLLLGTAAVESAFGTYLRQVDGPALGVFQMEPSTEFDIWSKFLPNRKPLRDRLINVTGQIGPNVRALESNISYQIAMARIHYLRIPAQLPPGNKGFEMAAYWKQYYNTRLGKGEEVKFVSAFKRHVSKD